MLQFETLLLRQLQKQQNRDEFCDTVLHTQGVSVPVHSCVLSAFSPRLYGTLSSMPVAMAGQRRLIEVQAVDADTLLSLVSLLYSGQLHKNREQVLSAAQTLGIELPQWSEEEGHVGKGKVARRKEREDVDKETEKEVHATDWDHRMTKRMEEGSGREKEKIRENGAQSGCGRETHESGAQTDLACIEPQSIQTVFLIDQSACLTNQELGSHMEIQDTEIHSQRKLTICDVLAMGPETGNGHTVSDSACVSQSYLYSSETSQHQPSIAVTPLSHNNFFNQSSVVPEADAENHLKQFEGNIPGFINHFLDSTNSQNIGRRGRGCVSKMAKEDQVIKKGKARSTDVGSVREWVGLTGGGRRKRCIKRWGLVARFACHGQGGGRVGRPLETRSTGKYPVRAVHQGKETLVEAGEARGRGRRGQRGKTGTIAGSEGQNNPPRIRRPRGRPRLRPLPPTSCRLSTVTPSNHYTVDATELDLLHTVIPVPTAQMDPIQPIDTFLDDIMTGLHFLPPAENQTAQHSTINTTSNDPSTLKPVSPNSHPIKPTDPKQHLEGELGDILDQFLRTFEQQVGCCGLDEGGETSDKFDAGTEKSDPSTGPWSNTSKTYTYTKPQANLLHASSTQPQFNPIVTPSVAKTTTADDGQIHGSKEKKLCTDQNNMRQFENQRLTRSQSMKRKLELALLSLQNPVKRTCKEKQSADNKKKQPRKNQGQSEACANKSGVNYLEKNKKTKATQACCKGSQKQACAKKKRQKNRSAGQKHSVENKSHKMAGFHKSKKIPQDRRAGVNGCAEMKKNVREDHVEVEHISNGFQAGRSPVKSQIDSSCIEIASSAMEKVRMLLHLQDEEEDKRANESEGELEVCKPGNRRLVSHKSISVAEERLPVENSLENHLEETQDSEDEGRVIDIGEFDRQERIHRVEVSQKQEDKLRMANELRQEEVMTEECREPFQPSVPSDPIFSAKEGNTGSESTLSSANPVLNTFSSWPGDPDLAAGVHLLQSEGAQPSTQSTTHKMAELTLDAPRLTSAARLSHTQPCQELLGPHTSTKDVLMLAEGSADEDEDVDVLEVSSPTSELPAVSTVILRAEPSTEEEEEEMEDVEIDVLGLESD